jgi:hypothetical protein
VDEASKTFAPELSPAGSRKWIGRLVIAVLLGVATWNFVVSLTTSVVMPALAQLMPADAQSPLYLGKGDLNIAALFTSFLELCFAAIAALVVNSWTQRAPRPARRKSVKLATPVMPASTPVAKPAAKPASPVPPPATVAPQPPSGLSAQIAPQTQAAHTPAPAAPPAETKPPKPKKVYYNLVGEQIESDEE